VAVVEVVGAVAVVAAVVGVVAVGAVAVVAVVAVVGVVVVVVVVFMCQVRMKHRNIHHPWHHHLTYLKDHLPVPIQMDTQPWWVHWTFAWRRRLRASGTHTKVGTPPCRRPCFR